MFSTVSNMPAANVCKTLSDLVISSRYLLTKPNNLVQSCQGNTVVDSKKTRSKAIADLRVESTSRSEAVLANNKNSQASSNIGGQSALTVTCPSGNLDTEQGKYDTCDKISRQTRLSKSKKPGIINSVALPDEDQMCNTDSRVKGNLARHTKTHGIKRSFQCDACKREFCRSSGLERHARVHTGEHPFQCDLCKRKFTTAGNLKRHAMFHTGEKPFQCHACPRTFNRADNLKAHTRTHSGARLFECPTCSKNFTRRCNLMTHIDTHNNLPRFTCDMCDARFYTKKVLVNHIRTHDGMRPFKCDTCGDKFKTHSNLWSHKQEHINARHFKCNICDARFNRKYILKKHEKIHTREHPYKTNKKPGRISIRRCTNDSNTDQPGPGHNNKKSSESSHHDASFTSTTTANQHIKSKTHTTNSETGLTTPGDVSTITQLPSVSNQPSTSDIHINKSQNQEEYREYTETVALLNEFADTYPITPMDPGSCEHHDHDDLFLDQEMPEATFPDKQNADAGYLITQLHPVAGWPLTSGIHVNKSQDQEKYEQIAKVPDYNYLHNYTSPQTIPGNKSSSW